MSSLMTPLQLVWHAICGLSTTGLWASARGPVLPLYVVSGYGSRPTPPSGSGCSVGSLCELRDAVAELGQPLVVNRVMWWSVERARSSSVSLLGATRKQGMAGLTNVTSVLNMGAVTACLEDIPQFGVIRRMRSRYGWARHGPRWRTCQ